MSVSQTLVDNRPQPSKAYRWLVLIFVSLAMFGNYYVYDALSPVADLLVKQLHFTDANIGLLQAAYSFPNIFTVVLGGIIIDRIGVRRATLIYGVLCFVGSVITVLTSNLWIMAAGRLVFGMGAESLIVAITTALAAWFKGKELSFAFGVNLAVCRIGSFAALNSPSWAKAAYVNWRYPFLIGVGMCTLCVVGAVIYWVMDAYAVKHYALGQTGQPDKVVFKDLFQFGVSYWYIVALCIVFYSGIFPFQTFAVKFFMDAHNATREQGGFLSSLLILFAMILTPLLGLLVDHIGKRAMFMMLGSLLLIPVYLMMAYIHWSYQLTIYFPRIHLFPLSFSLWVFHLPALLAITMAMMGITFSLIPAIMWPSVAYIVDPAKLGTAYGLMTMIQNIGLFGFNLLIGWANTYSQASASNPHGYRLGMQIFSILGFLGMMFAFLLHQRETGPHGHGLETITTHSQA